MDTGRWKGYELKSPQLKFGILFLLGPLCEILTAEFGEERPIFAINKVGKAHSRPELPTESIGDAGLGPN